MKAIKTLSKATDSFKELIIYYFGILIVSGVLYSFFEKEGLFNSLWWAVVTALTVGYGDSYPHTVGGKIVGVVLMHSVTLFIIPLIIGRIVTKVISDRNEFTHEEQLEIKKLLKNIAKDVKAKK